MQQASLGDAISVRVARKALDAQEQQGQAAVSMLQQALELGRDLAKSSGVGRVLDVRA
jgi:hydrogenase maturation factor HypF (carbamoyltransferase family)